MLKFWIFIGFVSVILHCPSLIADEPCQWRVVSSYHEDIVRTGSASICYQWQVATDHYFVITKMHSCTGEISTQREYLGYSCTGEHP